jgi:hypothetical protein
VSRGNRICGISIVSALAMCAMGCAPLFSADSPHWWNASVTSVVRQSEVPPKVDHYCLGVSEEKGNAESGDVAIVSIRLNHRMPSYQHAFPLVDGQQLHVGDNVLVQPHACKIKLADSGSM